jgi:signal transduction histidine kinase
MNAENLRKLKHELRTPVNHILGYSDLLLETADDTDDHETAGLAKGLNACGKMLAKLLEKSLMSPSGEMDDRQMGALRESIRPTVKQILQMLATHSTQSRGNLQGDLDRIRRAADQLLTLVGEGQPAISE